MLKNLESDNFILRKVYARQIIKLLCAKTSTIAAAVANSGGGKGRLTNDDVGMIRDVVSVSTRTNVSSRLGLFRHVGRDVSCGAARVGIVGGGGWGRGG